MNRNDLYRSFSEVDDETLMRTEIRHTPHRLRPRLRLMVAALALVLCCGGILFWLTFDKPKDDPSSWFVITAYATDSGDLTELGLNDACFNSGGTGENIFHVDVPVFSFTLSPANWGGNSNKSEKTYADFDVTVSYNGNMVDPKDKHIIVGLLYPTPGTDAPVRYGYEVLGWFEEPTDITISITDKDSGDLVEELTVNVKYIADSQAYQLTLIEVKTNRSGKQ